MINKVRCLILKMRLWNIGDLFDVLSPLAEEVKKLMAQD
jgi:hypothetical protein